MKFSFIGLLALMFAIVACGDDSSSSSPERSSESKNFDDVVVATYDDLFNCSGNRDGLVAYVKDEKKAYICKDRRWMVYDDDDYSTSLSSSIADLSSETSSKISSSFVPSSSSFASLSSILNSSSATSSSSPSSSSIIKHSSCSGNVKSSSSRALSSSLVKSSSSVIASSNLNLSSSFAKLSSSSSVRLSSSSSRIAVCSSSQKVSSSSVPEEPKVLIDSRDGQTYRIVKISGQIWMAENLNYEIEGSYCYNDSLKYCDKYGRLYKWGVAMDSAGVFSEKGKGCGYNKACYAKSPVRGVCPEGWHLPSLSEWEELVSVTGGVDKSGKNLRSSSGWFKFEDTVLGLDRSSFTVLPAGYGSYVFGEASYSYEEARAYFWSSDVNTTTLAKYILMLYNSEFVYFENINKGCSLSVRCVKDE